jgi:hypothetical protein
MNRIDDLKDKFRSILDIKIMDFRSGSDFVYNKLVIEFVDKSKLFVMEFNSELDRNYSYHWQNSSNHMIIRWDNAPHHIDILTFPHHKHEKDSIFGSEEISLEDVLQVIDTKLKIDS